MDIEYKKRFLKQLSKLPKPYAQNIEAFVFEQLPHYKSLEEIGKVEKMTGYKGYYKARFGGYRVGLKKQENKITIEIVMHRKEIYKYYP